MPRPLDYWCLAIKLLNDAPASNRIAVLYTRDANPNDVLYSIDTSPYADPSEPDLMDKITPTFSPVFMQALSDCSRAHDFQIPALHMKRIVAGVHKGDIAIINMRHFQPKSSSAFSTAKSVRALKNQLQILFPEDAPKLYGYVKCPPPTFIPVGA